MPDDTGPLCAHCGITIKAAEAGRPEELRLRHDLRVEPWDHLLEPALGVPAPLPPACDFCDAPEPAWVYPPGVSAIGVHADLPAEEEFPLLDELTRHDWLACDTCSVMIADRNLDGLVDRVLTERPALDAAAARRVRGTFGTFLSMTLRPHPYPD
ncbi:hypothetical protein [Actinomadura parmotrematis]|uniref:Uncharacterized protein n=1 Tax=Actinomadura parmotrematis TaxID=2864039 RepID=A0ABS7G1P7_9ACTN|nr:hypothetical protein [Actinomadura parmotrematis]MBW8485573.1 hypothetical protein [Actinomadura parmotrematis]